MKIIHQASRLFSRISLPVLSLFAICPAAKPTQSTQPNIVLIFIDDMGYTDISPFGNEQLRTSNLETLASQGRKFTNFYASPVCSMSRASLLTGCYNVRISMPSVLQPISQIGLNPKETNIANLLKKKNYATACIGKWHLGHLPEFLPHNQGFDVSFGIPYSNNMVKGYMQGRAPELPLYDGAEVIETEPDQAQFTKRFTERAVEFITANKEQPFFLYLPHPMIHTPLFASKDFKGKSQGGILGDAIEELDWSVGEIMKTLDELQLAENTLFIFTSDNGPATDRAEGLRDKKTTTFEGGVLVPTIMRWPGKIPADMVCDQITGTIDILPTLARLTDSPLGRPIDGEDISSLLFEADPAPVRDIHLYYGRGASNLEAIRQGPWKLFLGAEEKAPADEQLKKSRRTRQPEHSYLTSLYNLENDPGETADLSKKHPEVVTKLKALAKKMDTSIRANTRPIGRAKKTTQ